jgi:soluble lytic murein transglycosylase
MDPVNWIESIPFGETRNYVQRVIENVQVYRNRLAGSDQPSRILADLYRPNPPRPAVLKYALPAGEAATGPEKKNAQQTIQGAR